MKRNPSRIPDLPIFSSRAQDARIFFLAECVNHLHVAVQQRVGPERFRSYAQGPAATLPHDQDTFLWSRFTVLTPLRQPPLRRSIPLPSCSSCRSSISCRRSMPLRSPRRSNCPVSTLTPLWISSAATSKH